MELSQLRTLREVAETLNFTRAAERLGLTQSAVSHQIKSLEVELGEPLFVRAKRGVLLSEGGRAALEHSIRILDEVEALRVRLPGAEGTPSGRVRAAAATQAFVHLFAELFESFIQRVGRRPGLALESNDTYFVKLMVEHGLGVSLLPTWAVREEVAKGRLVRQAVAGHRLRRSVSMIFLGRMSPPATRAFVDF